MTSSKQKKNKRNKRLNIRQSDEDYKVPNYLTKEELAAASKDCLSYRIIETDRQKLRKVLTGYDRKEDFTKKYLEFIDHIFGFIIFNKRGKYYEIIYFINDYNGDSVPDEGDFVYHSVGEDCRDVDERGQILSENIIAIEGVSLGWVISTEPMLVTYNLDYSYNWNTFGFLETQNGLIDVVVCSPDKDYDGIDILYDDSLKPEDWTGKPYIRTIN